MEEVSDAALVSSAAAGDREAFGALYERYFDRVYDFLARMMRNPDEAADVAQETFVRAMGSLGSLHDGASFKSWVFTIARNTALNRIEKSGRVQPLALTTDDGEETERDLPDADRLGQPEEALASGELAALVWDAAKGMDPKQYSILDLHVRQGLESAEIAEVLGVTKNNGYVMLNRMKKSFEDAVRALVLLRTGPGQCADLRAALAPYAATELSPAIRRAIEKHTSSCAACNERSARVAPLAAFAGLAPMLAPAGLRERVLEHSWAAQQAGMGSSGGSASHAPETLSNTPLEPGLTGIAIHPGVQRPPVEGAGGRPIPGSEPAGGDPAEENDRRRKLVRLSGLTAAAVAALIGAALCTSALTTGGDGTPGTSEVTGSPVGGVVGGTTEGTTTAPTTAEPAGSNSPTAPPTSAIEPGPTEPGLAPGGGGGTTPTPVARTTPTSTPTSLATSSATSTATRTPDPGRTATPCTRNLQASPDLMDFGTTRTVMRFAVSGEGCGAGIAFRAAESAGWLSLSRASATTEPDGSVVIEATVNRAALGVGTYSATIEVTWDGGVVPVEVTVTTPSGTVGVPPGGSPSRGSGTTPTRTPTTGPTTAPTATPTPCSSIICP